MPVTINGTTGIAGPDGSASTPAVQGTDANTGLFYPAADTVALSTGGSERMRILSGGKVLINATTDRDKWDNSTIGSNLLQVERSASGGNSSISVTNNPGTFADAFSLLYLGRSRGTANNDYTAVASGDGLGVVSFQGADGTEFVEAASIRGYVDGTPGANDMPGRLMFFTTPDGSATPAERMRITSGGNLLVGTTSTSLASATTGTGLQYIPNNAVIVAANGGNSCLIANKTDSTTGSTAIFRYNGSTVGDISITSTNAAYNTASSSTNGAQLNYQGITFPATQSASSDANTLDDYEEGTFTPTLSASATAPTVSTYTTRTGSYIKIGSLVTCFIHIYCNISNAGSGYPIITGLPFTIATNADSGVSLGRWSAINSVVPVQAIVLTGGIYFESSSYVTGNNLYFNFSATYRV